MRRLNRWIPVAGWGLAVGGALVVFVTGGCKIIDRVQYRMEQRRHEREVLRRPADLYPPIKPADGTPPSVPSKP